VDLSLRKVLDIDLSGPQWLASEKGTDTTRSITLDVSKFSSALYPQNRLASGLYLGKITTGGTAGQYGPYDDTAVDGRNVCVGFLYAAVQVSVTGGVNGFGGTVSTAVPIIGALLWEGVVTLAAITTINNGVALDAAGQADLASRFRFE
jgi:hypothetical protein